VLTYKRGWWVSVHPIQLAGDDVRSHRLAMVLFRFVSSPSPAADHRVRRQPPVTIYLPVAELADVFQVLDLSKTSQTVGSVLVRGPPEPDAFAVSCANAPRFARNTLRATGRNGFDAQIPNANLGCMHEMTPVAARRPALVPHRDKDGLVPEAHIPMKTKQG